MKVAWASDRLLFGRMYEDAALELDVLPERGRVFCIASAGCTALALARAGREVTAVDVNPSQVAYALERAAGGAARDGFVDRLLAGLRRVAPLVGWTPGLLSRFARLDDPEEQLALWRTRLDTRRFRAALALLVRPLALRRIYAPQLVASLPPGFDGVLRRRLERGFASHPNAGNPYARRLLLGELPAASRPVELNAHCADAAAFLEAAPAAGFQGFTLSNVFDGARAGYAERLDAAVRRAAAPGAVLVVRSLAEPRNADEDAWAARDRSHLWGAVRVTSV